ncbi:MAG: transposase [Mogibacterium sp.]|nr:transposase [Mogibacterium sp.]
MTILPQNDHDGQMLSTSIDRFLKMFLVGDILRRCNARKEKGVPVMKIFRYLMSNVFNARSMYMQMRTDAYQEDFCKNTYYRFLNSVKTNWLKFTTMLSASVVNGFMRDLTGDDRQDVFIIDDTLYDKAGYKKTDMVARVFDHVDMRTRKGFRLLTLGWSDGNSFVPINFSLLSSANEDCQIGRMDIGDRRTLAAKRRLMALRKATDVMVELLEAALKAGHKARYVLFDTWFANPHQIITIKDMGLDTIAMVKKSAKTKYKFEGQRLNIKEIYSRCKKRRGRSRYLLSIEVVIGKDKDDEHPIPAKIVCVRNRNNRKDWIALISTDMDLSEDEIIRIYGKRWDIDVFFKTCKTYLKLRKECRSLSYDAMTAHVAIVFTRYMILSVSQRRDEDQRALGELFYLIMTELEDITFSRYMMILVEAMFQSVKSVFQITDEQLELFAEDFYNRLPDYMQKALNYTPKLSV